MYKIPVPGGEKRYFGGPIKSWIAGPGVGQIKEQDDIAQEMSARTYRNTRALTNALAGSLGFVFAGAVAEALGWKRGWSEDKYLALAYDAAIGAVFGMVFYPFLERPLK